MGYGLKVTGQDTAGGDFYVIDSDTSSTETLGIKTGGVYTASTDNRASVAANTVFSNYSINSGNFLFARTDADEDIWFSSHEVVTAGSFVSGYVHKIQSLGTTNWTSIGASSSPSLGELFDCTGAGSGTGEALLLRTTPIQAVKYLVLHPMSTLTSNINGSNYGIQIKNAASPSKVIFDSRKIINSVEIHKIFDKNSFVGGKWASMTTAQKAASLVWDGSSQSAEEWKNTYVTILGSHYFHQLTGATSISTRFGGYHFDNTLQKIYSIGYQENIFGGGIDPQYSPISNLTSVLVGELIQ